MGLPNLYAGWCDRCGCGVAAQAGEAIRRNGIRRAGEKEWTTRCKTCCAAPAARPLREWREDFGAVLWWRFPIDEPPYCGTPHDLGHTVELHTQDGPKPRIAARTTIGGWPGYHTHWTPIAIPAAPAPAADPAEQVAA